MHHYSYAYSSKMVEYASRLFLIHIHPAGQKMSRESAARQPKHVTFSILEERREPGRPKKSRVDRGKQPEHVTFSIPKERRTLSRSKNVTCK